MQSYFFQLNESLNQKKLNLGYSEFLADRISRSLNERQVAFEAIIKSPQAPFT